VYEGFAAVEVTGRVAGTPAQTIELEALAAIDDNTVGAMHRREVMDNAHGPAGKRRRFPEAGGE
jgi:hypothetical protein